MSNNALSQLEVVGDTAKRAQYEGFEFEIEAPGMIRVTNGSYGDEKEDHSYLVNVENGVPVACECKADEYHKGACKHRVAIAIREPVLAAATAGDGPQAVATDGGQVMERGTDSFGQELEHYDDPAYGAGEKGKCRSCGRAHSLKLVAGTRDASNEKWEEHYECDCGATGKFRFHGFDSSRGRRGREWVGSIRYPDEGGRR